VSKSGHDPLADLRNGRWLDAQDFPPLRYAVPGVFAEGLALNVGPPKIGKSWELLDVALGVAIGGVGFGSIGVGASRPVFLLALEDGDRRLQSRSRRLLDGAPIPEALDYVTRIEPGTVLDTIGAWLGRHGDACPVVILDTLGKVMPPALVGESAYQRDYRVGSALKRLADDHPGTTLIVNHHDRKAAADDFVDGVSGTNGLAGSADTVVVLSRNRHEIEGVLRVTGRDVAESEYAMLFLDGYRWQLDGTDLEEAGARAREHRAESGLADRSKEVLAFVNEHPAGVRAKEVAEALDLPEARRYLARLADSDRILRSERGVYVPTSNGVPHVPLSQQPPLTWDTGTVGTHIQEAQDHPRERTL
jgi:hypothetical protein